MGRGESKWLGSTAFNGTQIRKGTVVLEGHTKDYFEFYIIKPYGFKNKCFRARIGWKFGPGKGVTTAQWVFTVHPFKEVV